MVRAGHVLDETGAGGKTDHADSDDTLTTPDANGTIVAWASRPRTATAFSRRLRISPLPVLPTLFIFAGIADPVIPMGAEGDRRNLHSAGALLPEIPQVAIAPF